VNAFIFSYPLRCDEIILGFGGGMRKRGRGRKSGRQNVRGAEEGFWELVDDASL
jgi:hypothetical protein